VTNTHTIGWRETKLAPPVGGKVKGGKKGSTWKQGTRKGLNKAWGRTVKSRHELPYLGGWLELKGP